MPAHAARRPVFTPLGIFSGLFGLLVTATTTFLLLFQWNWLRGPLARYLSLQLDRPVAQAKARGAPVRQAGRDQSVPEKLKARLELCVRAGPSSSPSVGGAKH